MIIKKFQGKTEAEALESAKKELGQNVVIMNVKSVKKKGFFSILKPQLVEVTVALEEESERAIFIKREAQKAPAAPAQSMPAGQAVPVGQARDIIPEKEKSEKIEEALSEKLDNLQEFLEKQLQKLPEDDGSKKVEEKEEEESETVRFLKLLYNAMIDNEVNEKYANQILEDLDKTIKPNMPIDFILSNIYQKMILRFGKPSGIKPAKSGPKVVFFVGPTGVGKTTTIAKIASKFSVEEKKKVALLTADTYRIAAAEQLRTYANILEVPFRVIYSAEEMQSGIADFAGYDYILVDTAGHSHQNEAQRENMNTLLHCFDGKAEKEVYLVVSATTKYRDLVSIAKAYSKMTSYKIIFTKLDETTSLGNLLNLKLYTEAELSYITYGQNVPDDIADFNPQSTVKELLTGPK